MALEALLIFSRQDRVKTNYKILYESSALFCDGLHQSLRGNLSYRR